MAEFNSPNEWLLDFAKRSSDEGDLLNIIDILVRYMDPEDIQSCFQEDMDIDGYFDSAIEDCKEAAANYSSLLPGYFVAAVDRLLESGAFDGNISFNTVFAVALENIASRFNVDDRDVDYRNLKYF